MDFSPWDWSNTFRLHVAASLIAGVPPISKRFPDADEIPAAAKPALTRLYGAYIRGTVLRDKPASESASYPREQMLAGIPLESGESLKHAMASREELRRWVAAMGIKSAYSFLPQQADTKPQTAPAQQAGTAPAPVVEMPVNSPLPVTTGGIAHCFAGLRWKTEAEWKKPLGDKPKWLRSCIAIPGVQGVSETRWNPVCIGAALVHDGEAKANSVRARFQTKPELMPWLDVWKTYEANYLTTE